MKAATPSNAMSGFSETGIFSRSAIVLQKCDLIAEAPDQEDGEEKQNDIPSTSDSVLVSHEQKVNHEGHDQIDSINNCPASFVASSSRNYDNITEITSFSRRSPQKSLKKLSKREVSHIHRNVKKLHVVQLF